MIAAAAHAGYALVVGILLGSLPLGGLLIERLTGHRMKEFSAHNLGVENMLRFVGPPFAIAAFTLDVIKGGLALALGLGSPWAALGVFLGHLYPLPSLRFIDVPRGRGNGVLLGALAGLVVHGWLTPVAAVVPVVLFAAVLAWSRYAAVATLAALTVLALQAAGTGGGPLGPALSLLLLAAVWRHKSALARIADGTEPRIGDPPPVRGVDPGVVTAAFMIHPLTLEDLWQARSQRWLQVLEGRGRLAEALLRRALLWMRPQKHDEIRGIRLADGRELRVMLIGGPLLPDQIRENPELATRMAIQGARLAHELGAEAFGLGAFWSTVGDKGLEVQAAVPEIAITNGGAYTAGTVRAAVPGLLERFGREGGSLRGATAAVVGANGVVAFGVARLIAGDVGHLILVGRDPERLERSAETLRRKFPATRIETTTEVADVAAADLIFTATSDPLPVIRPEHVRPGAWIYDLGRPADVDPRVREVPGVHLIPGGVVRPPGSLRSRLDIHFGDGLVPACMAETMIMTATRAFDRRSLGPRTRRVDIDFYLREGERLGFEIVTRDERVAEPTEEAVP